MSDEPTNTLIRVDTLPHVHDLSGYETIELPMTSDDRRRVRRRLEAPDGKVLGLELPTGTTLHVGQALALVENKAYVVTAAPEDVLIVRPQTRREAAFVGHLIGNLHRDVDIDDDTVTALWDAPLEVRLKKAELDVERTERPFFGKPPGEHSH